MGPARPVRHGPGRREDEITAPYGDYNFVVAASRLPVDRTEGPDGEKGKTFRGIYELKGNDLKISFNGPNEPRPKAFDEDGTMAFVLERAKGK